MTPLVESLPTHEVDMYKFTQGSKEINSNGSFPFVERLLNCCLSFPHY